MNNLIIIDTIIAQSKSTSIYLPIIGSLSTSDKRTLKDNYNLNELINNLENILKEIRSLSND